MIAGRLHSAVLTRHYCRQQTTQAHKCSSSSHYARSRNVACFSHRHSEAASTDLSPRSLSIITGGSRGLGAQIAECLIDSFTSTSARHPHNHLCTGHDVLLLASNQRILEGTLEKLRQHASKHDGVRLLGHAVNLGGMAQLEHELLRLCSSMHEVRPLRCTSYITRCTSHHMALMHAHGLCTDACMLQPSCSAACLLQHVCAASLDKATCTWAGGLAPMMLQVRHALTHQAHRHTA